MDKKQGKVRIGISNGQVPGNKSTFPEVFQSKTRLHYYGSLFNTIEINSTFYKTPRRQTCVKWTDDVPDDFRFTLKLSRSITHAPELNYEAGSIEKFMEAASGICQKKGCLLIQFPGKITLEYFAKVEEILSGIRQYDASNEWRLAVEFRNESWYIRETTELLNEMGAAMVLHDFSKAKISTVSDNAEFSYLRFHGPEGNYRESYSDDVLIEKSVFIHELSSSERDVYVCFNNTAGNAYGNALFLKTLIKEQEH